MAKKTNITNRLKSLEEIPGISVEVTGTSDGTIRIKHRRVHAPEFCFQWMTDHFVGYFVDVDDKRSQAVVSLRTGMDAIRFVTAYAILFDIRAKKKG